MARRAGDGPGYSVLKSRPPEATKVFSLIRLSQLAIVPALQAHELFFHRLDVFGQLKERLENLRLGRGVLQRRCQRMHSRDNGRQLIALGAELLDGFISFHTPFSVQGGTCCKLLRRCAPARVC